jgi:hypothetical protein
VPELNAALSTNITAPWHFAPCGETPPPLLVTMPSFGYDLRLGKTATTVGMIRTSLRVIANSMLSERRY